MIFFLTKACPKMFLLSATLHVVNKFFKESSESDRWFGLKFSSAILPKLDPHVRLLNKYNINGKCHTANGSCLCERAKIRVWMTKVHLTEHLWPHTFKYSCQYSPVFYKSRIIIGLIVKQFWRKLNKKIPNKFSIKILNINMINSNQSEYKKCVRHLINCYSKTL